MALRSFSVPLDLAGEHVIAVGGDAEDDDDQDEVDYKTVGRTHL
eukprot:CAMPEP_0180029264 /NCGR_PEP_ID=MMETSP0984-20121128/26734_1 /TAXON_ID=483367 /ORGANISM="non described non described, Strain CCMP 2436" /LENGTH=43 /DNA_ID= /DNA_START= /DNA_END= /DNA_ORIENTATION=